MDWYAPIARHLMIPLQAWREGTRWPWYVREIAAWESLSAEEIAERQWRKMEALLRHAYENVPYYRRLFDDRGIKPRDIQAPDDLCRLPLLTQKTMREHGEDLVARNVPASELVAASSGGTTGLPMRFRRDVRSRDLHYAAMVAFARWYGVHPGDRQALIWGALQDLAPARSRRARLADAILRRPLVLNAFHLSECTMRVFDRSVRRGRPRMLRGYPHAIEHFAWYLEQRGLKLRIPSVVSTAEPLTPAQREAFRRVFDAEVFDEYGGRELGLMATECRQHLGLHVNSFSVYLEVLDGERPAEAGVLGRLVATGLNSYGMPFIRYDVGDVGRWAAAACPCGVRLPLLGAVEGREAGILVADDGRRLSGCALWQAMAKLDVPAQLQFVQAEDMSVEVRIAPLAGFCPDHEVAIRAAVRQLLGETVSVTTREVPAIPRAPSGKYVYSESRVARTPLADVPGRHRQ
jgi:phenylacetate-CoA ligase